MTIQQAFELALLHFQSGRREDAESALREVLQRQPDYADALHLAGVLAYQSGRSTEAAELIRRAVAANPGNAEYLNNLGLVLAAQGELDEGIAALQKAVQLRPDFAKAHNNLGSLYAEKRQWDQAIVSFRIAVAIDPQYAEAESNFASALKETGELDQAIQRYRRAASLKGDPKIASNLVYLLYFHPDYAPRQIADAHREWNMAFAAPLAQSIGPHANDASPDRKLRVGYVSPDFRQHAVARFIAPLLEQHDRSQFEIYCYADVRSPDDLTEYLRRHADVWRDTSRMSDEQLAELVRADRIDVLVDLTMHMEGGRPLVFARKPAPVQVTYLAYAGTTGLNTIDYRLSDPYLDPPDQTDDSHYSEKTLRLRSYWCYQAPPEAPPVVPPPSELIGHVTFGCLNGFSKVTGPALDTWARILSSVPESRLIIHSGEGAHRQRVLDRSKVADISPDRIEYVTRMPADIYFAEYNRIDIALDPFPYPGGTTTCDGLWMGLPVVTLAGATAVSRAGVSILSTIGLPELIALSTDEYVSIASQLAGDPARRAALRSTLRSRMQSSSLMDASAFAKDFEQVIRRAWRDWCRQNH
jgi:predicted O-linked N-acetylglucosamine transferase (SPINDLY family)